MKMLKNTKYLLNKFALPGYKPKHLPKLSSSYYHNPGETNTRLTDITLDQAFLKNASENPDKLALISYSENNYQITFKELEYLATKLADGFYKLGLKPKDKLAIWAPNIKEYYVVQLAAARLGLILVTMNPLYTDKEAAFTVELAECDAIVTPKGILNTGQDYVKAVNNMKNPPKFHILINNSEILHQNFEFEVPKPNNGPQKCQTIDYDDLLSSGEYSKCPFVDNKSDDIAMILFTSGTTGQPKAAATTHFSVINGALQTNIRQGALKNEIICMNVPLFHALGNICGSVVTSCTANTLLLPYYGWNSSKSVEAIKNTKATYMYGTPTMYIDLINLVNQNPDLQHDGTFDSLKQGLVAASVMPKEIFEQANKILGIQTQNFYGSTENSTVMIGCYLDDSINKKLETIGRAYDHLELKISGPGPDYKVMPLNTPGELCTRGWALFKGYLKNEEKTKQAVDSSRWYHTGDLAEMDEEGYIKIVGRIKDMLIRGGENVYPSEIESILLQHEDILDAQIVAAPDFRLGEVPAAYIRLKENSEVQEKWGKLGEEKLIEELRNHCGEELAKFKIPQYWKFVEVYPTTLSGKVKKYELRDRCVGDFGIEM